MPLKRVLSNGGSFTVSTGYSPGRVSWHVHEDATNIAIFVTSTGDVVHGSFNVEAFAPR